MLGLEELMLGLFQEHRCAESKLEDISCFSLNMCNLLDRRAKMYIVYIQVMSVEYRANRSQQKRHAKSNPPARHLVALQLTLRRANLTLCFSPLHSQEFEQFNKRLGDISRHVRIPLPVSNVLWEHCIRLANRTLVEGWENHEPALQH